MPDTKLDAFEDLPEMQNEETNQTHINGFDHMHNITPKYTFLTDINRDIESNPEENRPLCSHANSLLSTNLESNLGDNQSTEINVSICLFRKNKHRIITNIYNDDLRYPMRTNERTLELEYLSYYMDKKTDNQFGFPSFTYQLDDYRVQEEDDEDVDPFKEACIEHIMKLFSMEHVKRSQKHHKQFTYETTNVVSTVTLQSTHHTVDFGYHGMIRHEQIVYVFFDMNTIEQYFRTSPTHYEKQPCVWAVVDEIVRKHSVFSIPVHPSIVELFMENPMLWNISYEGTTLSFPRAMYGVVPSAFERGHIHADDIDELYESIETPDYKTATYKTRHPTKSNIVAPLLPFAHSDLFAERFLFTDNPIPIHSHIPHFENGLPKYKRFVVFIYNPKFIFSKKFKSHRQWINEYPQNFVENMDEEDDDQIEEYRKIPCICFSQKLKHHKPVEIWGVIHHDLFYEILQD